MLLLRIWNSQLASITCWFSCVEHPPPTIKLTGRCEKTHILSGNLPVHFRGEMDTAAFQEAPLFVFLQGNTNSSSCSCCYQKEHVSMCYSPWCCFYCSTCSGKPPEGSLEACRQPWLAKCLTCPGAKPQQAR